MTGWIPVLAGFATGALVGAITFWRGYRAGVKHGQRMPGVIYGPTIRIDKGDHQ